MIGRRMIAKAVIRVIAVRLALKAIGRIAFSFYKLTFYQGYVQGTGWENRPWREKITPDQLTPEDFRWTVKHFVYNIDQAIDAKVTHFWADIKNYGMVVAVLRIYNPNY